ncbi:MAG: minor capsid protein [Treponema sp.]
MTFDVKSEFHADDVRARLTEKVHRAQMKLDIQIVSDCEYFVPKMNMKLRDSGIAKTVAGSGQVRWTVDYARRQYYGVNFDHSKSRNPNATAKWFESAKARKKEDWRRLVEDEIKHC